jgi:hypothetical protein
MINLSISIYKHDESQYVIPTNSGDNYIENETVVARTCLTFENVGFFRPRSPISHHESRQSLVRMSGKPLEFHLLGEHSTFE